MSESRRNLVIRLIIVVSVGTLPSVASSQNAPSEPTSQRSTFIAAVDSSFPPYQFVDKGKITGFDVDLLSEIANVIGMQVRFLPGSWDQAINNLKAGKADVVPGVIQTSKREEFADFTEPYSALVYSLFVLQDSHINTLGDVWNKTVVVQKEGFIEQTLLAQGFKGNLIRSQGAPTMLRMVADGKCDATLLPKTMGLHYLHELGIKNVHPSGEILTPKPIRLAVRDGDVFLRTKLNEGLKMVIADGTFRKLEQKWFRVHKPSIAPPAQVRSETQLSFFAVASAVLTALVLCMFVLLRRAHVNLRKRERETADIRQKLSILEQNERKNNALLEASGSIVIVLSPEGQIEDLNSEGEKLLGSSRQEILHKNYLSLFVPQEKHHLMLDNLQLVLKGTPLQSFESPLVANGTNRTVCWNAVRILDADNHPCAIMVVGQDVTHHKKSQQEALESQRQFRSMFLQTFVPMLLLDKDNRIIQCNKALGTFLGYSPQEMQGMDFVKLVPPDSVPAIEKCHRQLITGKISRTIPMERQFLQKDGEHVWGRHVAWSVLNPQGQFEFTVCTIEDITRRKESEQETFDISLFPAQNPNPVLRVCQGGILVYANEAATPILRQFKSAVGDIIPNPLREKVLQVLETHKPCDAEFVIGERSFLFSITPLGEPPCANLYGHEITLRKSLQHQLQQIQKMEAIGRLAGGIAHDFNNLLTPILGYCDMAMRAASGQDRLSEDLKQIHLAAERAQNLTQQMLALGRRQVFDMKPVSLNSIVLDVEKMLRRVVREDIEIRLKLAEHVDTIQGDKSQVEQILLNLSVNASDAMPEGGLLAIETSNVELDKEYADSHVDVTPGHYVMMTISDTGCGMSTEVLEKALEPFFTTKEKGKGTGLGLSIVHGIVRQHGGHLWIYSEPSHGTSVKIYFPRIEQAVEYISEKAVTPKAPVQEKTILVVEDEEMVRRLACAALDNEGYRVLEAASPDQALETAASFDERIDLLLTDVVMPGINGSQLLEKLRQTRPDVGVLYMSGYTDEVIAHHGILQEDTHFLQKPFTLQTLCEKVIEALESSVHKP